MAETKKKTIMLALAHVKIGFFSFWISRWWHVKLSPSMESIDGLHGSVSMHLIYLSPLFIAIYTLN